ncbi:MAG: hypothetical protein K2H20_02435, partial [Bacilli bacterium]|nr:hypothetical protein [Bacilli bacterium]
GMIMIDLTTREKDKNNFITKVYLKEDTPKYCVQYASGRIEEYDFTIHNFNASLSLMEQQYHAYKEEFFYKKAKEANLAAINKLKEGVLALVGIVLTTCVDMSIAIKILMSLLIVVCSVFYQKSKTKENAACGRAIDVLAITEKFLANKEQFRISVTDPITNTEEDWYLLTLTDIEAIENKLQVTLIGSAITEEIKEEESKNVVATLKKKWRLGD